MRTLTLVLSLVSATASAAELPPVSPHVVFTYGQDAAGYEPGLVVRPDGDRRVTGIPAAVSSFDIDVTLGFGKSTLEVRPFMLNTSTKNGPTVVGLRYEARYSLFDCRRSDGFAFDVPWREPCVEVGAAHYSAHNADDGTYGSVYTNGLLARMRVASAAGGKTATWLAFVWYFGALDSPFALTPATDIRAGDLERKMWRAALTQDLRIGDGDLAAELEVLASDSGPASGGVEVRYLHTFHIAVDPDGPHGFSLSPATGAEFGYHRNFRKTELLGTQAARFQFLIALPFGN